MDTPHKDGSGQFDDETIVAFKELGNAFLAVRKRLISEGYTFIDGQWIPPTKEDK